MKRRGRRKLSRGDQRKVSEKIRLLRREGKDERSSAGEAYGMLRSGRLRRHGKYVRKRARKPRAIRS